MATLLNEAQSFDAAMRLIRATAVPSHPSENKRRVLIVDTGSLMEAGVEMLLRRERDLHVSGCPFIGESALARTVAHFEPDVIILNESSELTVERVLQLLASQLPHTALRVIVVRSRDNTVDVYEHRRVAVTEVGDLLKLIR